ncbi:hypothetical protein EVAR_44861_1 [Eumeta japonica]|uniref:Uncharacterized protein n=1 Tax=Eumeta variegata TaxID=151549 RepID=A0A4C1Y797_EUMVA|nr:hypothetical protein EVAR_44861_1 [Eumeta japonica]
MEPMFARLSTEAGCLHLQVRLNSGVVCGRCLSYTRDASPMELKRDPLSHSHARLRRNVTMNRAFSCVPPTLIDL